MIERRVVESFFDELDKLGQFGGDIDDLYAAPNSSIMPTLKRVHNLGKSSSWTDIGPVGQRDRHRHGNGQANKRGDRRRGGGSGVHRSLSTDRAAEKPRPRHGPCDGRPSSSGDPLGGPARHHPRGLARLTAL